MKEADLFRAFGLDHNIPIPTSAARCATPTCRNEALTDSLFCNACVAAMQDRITKSLPERPWGTKKRD